MSLKPRLIFVDDINDVREPTNKILQKPITKAPGIFYSENPILCHGVNINNKNTVIEPFVGSGSLLDHFGVAGPLEIYDLNPPKPTYLGKTIEVRDCLLNPPNYSGKTLITNPPYLASNKMDTSVKTKYSKLMKKCDDLFKIFIKQIVNDPVTEGFIVLPFSFLFSIRKNDVELRESFLQTYKVIHVNIFLSKVFRDTTTNVISIHFVRNENDEETFILPCSMIQSEGETIISISKIELELNKENKYLLGGELYKLNGTYTVGRYVSKVKGMRITNIRAVCLDSKNERIRLVYDENIVAGKHSDRMGCFITCNIELNKDQQLGVIELFNELLNEYRDKYCSLFLTNYRDGNRKRISFQLLFNLVSYVIGNVL